MKHFTLQKHAKAYVCMLPVLIALLHTTFFESAYFNAWAYYALLLATGLLLGSKDIRKTCAPVDGSWKRTWDISLLLLVVKGVLASMVLFGMSLGGNSDPQGILDQYHSVPTFWRLVTVVPIIAVSEEVFKLLMLFGFIAWMGGRTGERPKLVMPVLLASLCFGFVHSFEYSLAAMVPIAVAAIPTYYILLRYGSIIPLIITHFCWDAFFLAGQIEGFGPLFVAALQPLAALLAAYYAIRAYTRKLDRQEHMLRDAKTHTIQQ